MKKTIVCFLVVLGLAAIGQAQRLPETAVPSSYKLTFSPDFTNDTFGGDEIIQINVPKPTSKIVLNAAEIKFEDVTIDAGGKSQKANVATDEKNEMATLTVPNEIPAGAATIHIKYTGILNDKLRGFYLSKSDGRKFAVTQFEATDARRAFPSWDEPDYKATFDITIVAPKTDTAISNGKMVSDTPGPGANEHTMKFATTPKLSSYLVAMLVGEWKCISDQEDGIPLRVCSVPGKEQMSAFAMEATKHILHYYDQYFAMKYPFHKLDQIAIPDFEAGAMENAGAITYRESLLLADPKTVSEAQKVNIAGVIAHEMAHQWFGDLVTMKWWDDIWLNEGFATWMTAKPLEAWKPEWKQNEQVVADANDAINGDSVVATRPIHQAAETPAEINALFDGIAYGKTAAVLHMVESYLGPETFRKGVNRYLEQHQYANATAQDFWNTQAAVSKKPADKVMRSFVMQPGVPFVDASVKQANGKTEVTLSQKRYYYDPSLFAKGGNETWTIPVCLEGLNTGSKAGTAQCELLTKEQQTFTLPNSSSRIFPNAGAAGYYRYAFDADTIKGASLETELKPEERLSLVANAWALVRSGSQTVPQFLSVVDSLKSDRDYFVLSEVMNRVQYISRHLTSDNDRPEFQKWVRGYFKPVLDDIGMMPKPGEAASVAALRPNLYGILGGRSGEDPEIIAQCQKLTQEYMKDPASVPPDLSGVTVEVAALHGNAALYDQFMAKLKETKTPQEYYHYFYALSDFQQPELLQRTLEFALTPAVRNQDLYIIPSVMGNRNGTELAWNFVKAHWDDLVKKAGGGIEGAAPFALGGAGSFCDAQKRDDLKNFYESHPIPGTERQFHAAEESINYCIELKQRQEQPLSEWLQKNT
ncbi:MAG TPA: M1 family metallopeptidase [Terriglobales bacterium]|nr:M1 family metallopeptidase [Terriglobales bacterium]